jgi:hypothetical protein
MQDFPRDVFADRSRAVTAESLAHGGRRAAQEISSLIRVGRYSLKAWMVVGDVQQAAPHMALGTEGLNPFGESMTNSILSEAIDLIIHNDP